jgi:glycine cleavage system aminomethyltransferase T
MSTIAQHEDAFASILRRAGAVFATPEGRLTVVDFGSAAGELAVCLTAVGLVDRSELTKLVVEGPAGRISALLMRLADTDLAVGGVARRSAIWWCRDDEERVIAICEATRGRRLWEELRRQARRYGSIALSDRSRPWTAIELIGRATPEMLAALGVYERDGDSRHVAPFSRARVGPVDVTWLLESPRRALALLPRAQAATAWRALEEAGRPFAISCVGQQAASRYSLLDSAL